MGTAAEYTRDCGFAGVKILNEYSFGDIKDADTYHKQIEAIKLALSDGLHYVTDSNCMKYGTDEYLSDEYIRLRKSLINNKASNPRPGTPTLNDTIYLAAADNEGNMVSFIQSNYMGFGSGLVVPGTGIALQNRGHSFSMSEEHSNALAGGKKTFHTIMPGFLTKNSQALGPFGVMGGLMMPQGHVQVLSNMIDFHMNPQSALDAPRWKWIDRQKVEIESGISSHILQLLSKKGHDICESKEIKQFGRGQIILKDPEKGVLIGGTEYRTDGTIAIL